MRRILNTLRRSSSNDRRAPPVENTPEGDVIKAVRLFCESDGPNGTTDDGAVHLPSIVEGTESSPSAAREAALQIRKYLSKDNYGRAQVQYNAMMLVRILADNPGPTFTRNLDGKFSATMKELLRFSRDASVQQMARETLEHFEREKGADENLAPLRELWAKDKKMHAGYGIPNLLTHGVLPPTTDHTAADPTQQQQQQQQNYFARNHRVKSLPAPQELVGRIEEAKTSAKLLLQVVQSTPPAEMLDNELVKEFSHRCQSASRSIQGYINAEDPAPDDDTLLTLIETNDQLSLALSKHQRAVLEARKALASHAAEPSAPVPPASQGVQTSAEI